MRPPRLAHLTTIDLSLATLLRTELEVDVAAGFDVYGISAPGPHVGELAALGVRHVPIPSFTRAWSPTTDLRAARELARVLRRLHLDVLHTHTPKAGVLGRVLGRLAGIEIVVNTCHGLWATASDPPARRGAVLAIEGMASRWSHAELYQNAEDRAALGWAVPPHRSRLVGNGIDLERFRPDPSGRAAIRNELGVSADEVLVGAVGRRVAEKGVAEFTEMARALADRARFVWVGPEDPDKPDAITGGDEVVRYLGMRRDMPQLYSALDVFVLPSYREGFSRSAMEAAACGTAMVLSDIRGCREIGSHGHHLLLVPPGEAGALTAAVERLIAAPRLRRRLGAAARGRAQDRFDQRRIAAISIDTYADVATRKRSPSQASLTSRRRPRAALTSRPSAPG